MGLAAVARADFSMTAPVPFTFQVPELVSVVAPPAPRPLVVRVPAWPSVPVLVNLTPELPPPALAAESVVSLIPAPAARVVAPWTVTSMPAAPPLLENSVVANSSTPVLTSKFEPEPKVEVTEWPVSEIWAVPAPAFTDTVPLKLKSELAEPLPWVKFAPALVNVRFVFTVTAPLL
jgi:hypothetical protein